MDYRDLYRWFANAVQMEYIKKGTPVPVGGGSPVPPEPEPEPLTFTFYGEATGSEEMYLIRYGTANVVELEYKLNDGEWTIWQEDSSNWRRLTITSGDAVKLRNTSSTRTRFSYGGNNRYGFGFTGDYYTFGVKLSGDLRSLLAKENWDTITIMDGDFHTLFGTLDCPLVKDISELKLESAGNFGANCYNQLFRESPKLYGKVTIKGGNATNGSFANMFFGTEINDITIDITDCASSSFGGWLTNGASRGTIRCPEDLPIGTGISGVPAGWTRLPL